MKFDCKEISISDEPFGCTLTLSEEIDNASEKMEMSIEQIMSSSGQYLLLQRTYPEDDFEEDYYYCETSDFDKSGELKNFKIELNKRKFVMTKENDLFEINIHPTDEEYNNLKKLLAKLIKDKGQLMIND
jgi:hypothetical protein